MASARAESLAGSNDDRYPIRGTFFGCCALTVCTTAKIRMATKETSSLLFTGSAPHPKKLSLDHLISPHQHIRRNREADLLGGFEIDDELELLRLLHR